MWNKLGGGNHFLVRRFLIHLKGGQQNLAEYLNLFEECREEVLEVVHPCFGIPKLEDNDLVQKGY